MTDDLPIPPLLSLCLITYNEERNLDECLASFTSLAGEIIVVDSGSSDRTREIAEKHGARFHVSPFDGFGRQKQKAIDLATGSWVFVVDADERATPSLVEEVRAVVKREPAMNGYEVNRVNFFLGKPILHSGWAPDHVLRLFRKGAGRTSDNLVHEEIRVSGKVGRLSSSLHHYTYRTLDDYLKKSARYAALSSKEKLKNGARPGLFKILLDPPFVFFKMYVMKQGFRDGREGLFLAILYGFYTAIKYIWMYYPEKEAGGTPSPPPQSTDPQNTPLNKHKGDVPKHIASTF